MAWSAPRFVIRDDRGIGGFFEDLPVLAFVLAGIALLISSSIWSAHIRSDDADAQDLEEAARKLVRGLLLTPFEGIPSLDALSSVCCTLSKEPPVPCSGYLMNVSVVHPYVTVVGCASAGFPAGQTDDVAFAAGVMNAVDEARLTVIVEVRVLAW